MPLVFIAEFSVQVAISGVASPIPITKRREKERRGGGGGRRQELAFEV